ncbi:MAG: hypothetical protein A3H97_20460 [Acidobacteria bacterium RIFCSPLOWO2_02_FULL_65_29]|nr:MAG: hypothetical protein A3H97_20460 [Acidobacteria bacterium RIFCSPLOWO2_02_FULL_65_29]
MVQRHQQRGHDQPGQGPLNYFLRARNCGSITEAEALELSGLTVDELRGKSFVRILENRRT